MTIRQLIYPAIVFSWLALSSSAAANQNAAALHLDVHKSPSCGCCTLWMDHLADNGFESTPHHPDELGALKRELGVPVRYGSCHTGVSKEGFVFEGHVPARYIGQFMAYEVLLLKADGTVEVCAAVESYEQQFE